MSGESSTYLLPRNENESRRLYRQHRLWTKTTNYLIHPVIEPVLSRGARIADVATGTGAWVLATARTLPGSVTFIGFGVCESQFPKSIEMPKNVSFEIQHILKPFPQHHLGTFDLVSLRDVASVLAKDKWELAARSLTSLLKPGGYIQWMEADMENCRPVQHVSQASCESLTLLSSSALSYLRSKGKEPGSCRQLPEIFVTLGLEDCTQDIFSSDRDPHLRAEFTDVHARTLLSVMETAGLQMWNGWNCEKVRELERKVFWELEIEVAYMRGDFRVVIGRLPGTAEK